VIAVVVQITVTNGVPDLNLPASVQVVREGAVFHVSWGDDRAMSIRLLGIAPNGTDRVFVGMMTPRVAQALAGLGAAVARLRDVWATPARRTWLLANGVSELAGVPLIPHTVAGQAGGPDADPVPLS
jgi:hypothetical protein